MRQLLCAFRATLVLLCVTGMTALLQAQVAPGAGAPAAGGYQQGNGGYPAGGPATNSAPAAAPQPQPPQAPQPPFTLNPAEQQQLDALLVAWQHSSDQITTYSSDFQLWEYNRAFGPPPDAKGNPQALRFCEGALRYAKPDKGFYKVTKITRAKVTPGAAPGAPPTVVYEEATEPGEHWVCDGKSIFELSVLKKQLIERPLPPELQGKSIGDGPMPFVFGAEANKLKARYWMRITTPPNVTNMVYLEAVPKTMGDAANYSHIDLMLDSATLTPTAVRIFEPDGNHKVYQFSNQQKNAMGSKIKEFFGWFVKPTAPWDYQNVVERIPTDPAQGPGQSPPSNAQRPGMPNLPR